MKTERLTFPLAACLSLALAGVLPAAETAKPAIEKKKDSRIEVVFTKPETYADAKDSSMATDQGRDYILGELREYLTERAEKILPAGQKLKLEFTEVDLAGEYEPWRMPPLSDVRIVKDIYPPRFDFSYTVLDEKTGTVVLQGKETLRDMAFMMRLTIDRNDPLRFEKDMLGDWLRATLIPQKKKG
jgi:hypothetical protein